MKTEEKTDCEELESLIPIENSSTSTRLSGATLTGVLIALDECIDALIVCRGALIARAPVSRKKNCLMPALDFHVSGTSFKLDNASRAAFEMAEEEQIIEKLQSDSQWLEQLLTKTRESLVENGSLNVLIDGVKAKASERTNENELLTRSCAAQERLERIRREVADECQRRAAQELQLKSELTSLRNEKEKLSVLVKAESSYVDAWLVSRREQSVLKAELTRQRLNDELRQCEERESHERLVNQELTRFLQMSIEKNEKATRDWTDRKQIESKSYERKIHGLREEIERRRLELEQLRKEYDTRQEFIDICLAEREAQRRQLELEEHRRSRAILIQAWWRGVMVRRKLGPYRPEEKRRKRPAKGKK